MYVHRVPFVVGPVEVEVPAWLGSWRNMGHQSVSVACTVAAKGDATKMAATDKATANQILLFIFSLLLPSCFSPEKERKNPILLQFVYTVCGTLGFAPGLRGDIFLHPLFFFSEDMRAQTGLTKRFNAWFNSNQQKTRSDSEDTPKTAEKDGKQRMRS